MLIFESGVDLNTQTKIQRLFWFVWNLTVNEKIDHFLIENISYQLQTAQKQINGKFKHIFLSVFYWTEIFGWVFKIIMNFVLRGNKKTVG